MMLKGKKAAIFFAILIGIVIMAALFFTGPDETATVNVTKAAQVETETVLEPIEYAPKTEPLSIKTVDGKQHQFQVELATSPVEWQHGLMYRTELPVDHGMLFIFPEEDMRSFWMKNTLIPLDMIFIRKNGEIVNIQKNAVPKDLTSRPSTAPALAVLEINGGMSDKLGLKAGDIVYHSAFGNDF